MHALSQKIRPKHQVLVLKCYPRTTKGAVDVKPNSSELSYLLYYAVSRRSKIQKVGNFLERKTASDVWRLRIGNVQVTLQILEALIEKAPKDLPLFAPNVLKILDAIIRSNDITMVESSIPTFKAFCEHHDASTLLADQQYLAEFEAVVRNYASFASVRLSPGKSRPSKPVAMRWRVCGLEAIRAVAAADALSSLAGAQYDIMVPMILENLWSDSQEFLDVLLQRAESEEKEDTERMLKRRNSVATVRTADTSGDTNPIALFGTAMDVDKLAEQDIGVLAVLCLKQIYVASNRSLIHLATSALLNFIKDRIDQGDAVVHTESSSREGGWSVAICSFLLRWAPVQERYIILITIMDTLAHAPLADNTLEHHIALTTMIGSLLRSDASLIGLSVMDVLLGFIQHIKKLIQMPGDPATAAVAAAAADAPPPGRPDPRSPTTLAAIESVATTASKRKELLTRLQQCIGDLATHVYYADQISDMISTILHRLKAPRSGNGTGSSTPPDEKATDEGKADDKADVKADEGAADSSPKQNNTSHQHDSLFTLAVTKTTLLKAVKAILVVANPTTRASGNNQTLSRNRVPIQVWESTDWLLRDSDGQVRKAYVDALLTWLDRELSPADQRARDEDTIASSLPSAPTLVIRPSTRAGPAPAFAATAATFARRAVSSASNREPGTANGNNAGNKASASGRRRHVFFLSLLHLAIYDNALQFVDYETDIVLLHVLLNKLVEQLGVNATRYGLPMIFQLQEAIQDVETPQAKVRVGSLVHGYFWTLTEKFRFESSMVGHAILNEVTRRRSKHFWVEGVHVPPPLLELVGTPGMSRPQPRMPLHEIESEALLPFDDRLSLVDNIGVGYRETVSGSPPQSPTLIGGSFSASYSFGTGGGSGNTNGATASAAAAAAHFFDNDVPASFKDDMLSDWSREGVMQTARQQAGSKSVSLSGSRSGTMAFAGTGRGRFFSNSTSGLANEYINVDGTGFSPSASHQNLGTQRAAAAVVDPDSLAPVVTKLRKSSVRSGVSPSPGGSHSSKNDTRNNNGAGFVTSIDQLKMALAGAAVRTTLGSRHGGAGDDDDDRDSSDSMASFDMSASEFSFNPPPAGAPGAGDPAAPSGPPSAPQQHHVDGEGAALLTVATGATATNGGGEHSTNNAAVPPVPPLPSPIVRQQQQFQQAQQTSNSKAVPTPSATKPASSQATRRSLKSRGGDSILSSVLNNDGDTPALDLNALLKGIDSRAGATGLGNISRPPY